MKTIILGGGLAGLTLARLLTRKGEDVLVLEHEDRIGGLCRSEHHEGFTFDIGGSHIIFSRDQEVLSFMKDILCDNREERERNTKIFYKGRYLKYPFENGLSELPPEDCFFCLNEYIRTLIDHEKGGLSPPENFLEWIYYTFGKGIAELYMVPYNEKIWNYPLDQMSMHWVDGRIPRPPVEDIIRSAVGIETEGYVHQSVFSYPAQGGIEALITAIVEPIQDKIRCGFTVRSVTRVNDGWEIGNGSEIIHADRCISTIPLQYLVPCLSDLPDIVRDAVADLKYNSIACVGLGLSGDIKPISWMYLPENGCKANRISFPSNFSRFTAPEGCSSVLAEITYNDGDEISQMTDQKLIEHVISSLGDAGIIRKEQVISSILRRHVFAYVVYDLNYCKNIEIIREYFRTINLPLLGRFSQFEYLNMDGVIRSVCDFVRHT